jgi:predicted DNA-binding helix-hairpin-helix protein
MFSGGNRKTRIKDFIRPVREFAHYIRRMALCSLLKNLLTNFCIYDCAYLRYSKSNDIQRAALLCRRSRWFDHHFYRRNYIEGFFKFWNFSKMPIILERLVVWSKITIEHNFNGYIHLKSILVRWWIDARSRIIRDRLSMNWNLTERIWIELLVPDKNHQDMIKPMRFVKNELIQYKKKRKI